MFGDTQEGRAVNTVFSVDEKAVIPTVTVWANENLVFGTNSGNATRDQVFLLSIEEANEYFSSNYARRCEPTDFAVANNAYKNDDFCWWYLRSPGFNQSKVAGIGTDGDVKEDGNDVDNSGCAVRPALWIDLNP